MESACIKLSRKIFAGQVWGEEGMKTFANKYIELLISGTSLDSRPTQQEREKQEYDSAKLEEMRRLGREDAKVEREAAKKLQQQEQKA